MFLYNIIMNAKIVLMLWHRTDVAVPFQQHSGHSKLFSADYHIINSTVNP